MKCSNPSFAWIYLLHTTLLTCHLKTETSHVFKRQHFHYLTFQTETKSSCSFHASLRQQLAELSSLCSHLISSLYNSSLLSVHICAYLRASIWETRLMYTLWNVLPFNATSSAHILEQMCLASRKSNSSMGLGLEYLLISVAFQLQMVPVKFHITRAVFHVTFLTGFI